MDVGGKCFVLFFLSVFGGQINFFLQNFFCLVFFVAVSFQNKAYFDCLCIVCIFMFKEGNKLTCLHFWTQSYPSVSLESTVLVLFQWLFVFVFFSLQPKTQSIPTTAKPIRLLWATTPMVGSLKAVVVLRQTDHPQEPLPLQSIPHRATVKVRMRVNLHYVL